MAEERRPEILWVDDEIDLLKSQIQFLENRGYRVTTVTNGPDAVALVNERPFDAVLLDEIMVGMDGIETLHALKAVDASLPVIMVTKSTEETLMDDAYFGETDDFLVKPVNPHQILSSLKKVLDLERLRRDRFVGSWGEYYNRAQHVINDPAATFADWADLYLDMCRARREIADLNLAALEPLQNELVAEADRTSRGTYWTNSSFLTSRLVGAFISSSSIAFALTNGCCSRSASRGFTASNGRYIAARCPPPPSTLGTLSLRGSRSPRSQAATRRPSRKRRAWGNR
jgi:DNA-binding response OmpR family regulator